MRASLREPLRGALLGCGAVSEHHLKAWAQVEGVAITALYNRTPEKAHQRAAQIGLAPEHVYTDLDELLARERLDFVDIATAPSAHREQVERAAAAGRAVLCQKPLAPSLADAQAMRSACRRAGVLFSVNENWRWRPWYRETKRLLERGTLGRLRYARFAKHSNITLPGPEGDLPRLIGKQAYTAEMEHLILFEWGTHLIDTARFLFGEPQRVYARLDRSSAFFRGEDRALVVLEYSEMTVLLDLSWASVADEAEEQRGNTMLEQFRVEGDQGLIEILPEPETLFRLAARGEAWERPVYTGDAYLAYLSSYTAAQCHFAACLREGRAPETVVDDNLKTLQATLATYQAAERRQVIDLSKEMDYAQRQIPWTHFKDLR